LLIWATYASLAFLESAIGGSFEASDVLAESLFFGGMGISLVTGLGAGLFIMEMVRTNSLKKWQGIVAVLLPSAVSAIAPPIILSITDSPDLALILLAGVTFCVGIVNFVAFSIGILCVRTKGKAVKGDVVDSRG